MNETLNEILFQTPDRKIQVWRRIGGGNPGYGLDVDGKTVQFAARAWVPLKERGQELAKERGQELAKPQVDRVPLEHPAGREATHTEFELDRMLGRFYMQGIEAAFAEPMEPKGRR